MSKEFEIDAYRKENELLIVFRGRLVLRYCQEVKTRLGSLFTPQITNAYLYLAELAFLDSAGLGVMVGLKMQANRNRSSLIFLAPPARVEDIFRVSKLNTIFESRGGVDADVIYASLRKDEYCMWSDSREMSHAQFNTEHGGVITSGATLTPPHQSSRADEIAGRVNQLCHEAVEYLRQADYDRAIATYREALNLDPDNLSALNNLGVVYEKDPKWYRQSLETWQRVLELSEKHNDTKHAARARKHIDSLSKLTDT